MAPYPGRTGTEPALETPRVPCLGGIQIPKESEKAAIPVPNRNPHIEQITSLKSPPPAAAAGIQKSSSPSFGANLEERLRLGTPMRPTRAAAAPAQSLGTWDGGESSASGVQATACSPPEPGQSHRGGKPEDKKTRTISPAL